MKKVKIGWCVDTPEYKIAFEPPEKLIPPKDKSENQKGYLSCPAVRSYCEGHYIVKSPYTVKLRCFEKEDRLEICPVFPFTSINNSMIKTLYCILVHLH